MTELTWKDVLGQEKLKPYFQEILAFVDRERAGGKVIYPPRDQVFNAFRHTRFADIRVVIIGQDPYHEPGQAHGLSFSVCDGVSLPPSLQNILKEVRDDVGADIPMSGNLTRWAQQGILLLNATLTVRAHQANSHSHLGWQQFTDAVIKVLTQGREHIVYMLWGSYARSKRVMIDHSRNLVLESVHPSPLSANRGGWFGQHQFSRCNQYLQETGQTPIAW